MTPALIEWRNEYLIGDEELDNEDKDRSKRLTKFITILTALIYYV